MDRIRQIVWPGLLSLVAGAIAPCYSQTIGLPAPGQYPQPVVDHVRGLAWSGSTSTCVTPLGLVDFAHYPPHDVFTLLEQEGGNSSPDPRRLRRRLTHSPIQNYEFLGLFNPEDYAARAGVYAIDPYQPGKIPVVLVQGIWSSPKVWVPMLGALRGDPKLLVAYQFWVVLYPSCYPLPIAALSLRQSLRESRQRFDPRGTDLALDQMVILGKSTGGQVTRMLVEPSGEALWNAIFTRPIDQVCARPELRAQLVEAFFFQREPSVRRAIFVATAHRGNQAGAHPLARFGVGLMQRNNPLRPIWAELEKSNGRTLFQPHLRDRALSSADGLEAENPMLMALAAQPISPDVAFHSIIANIRHKTTPEKICDGIVEHRSAHIDGATSERIVTATHVCEADREVIDEVRRILYVHLSEQRLVSP
jgi:hypothetical protein